MLVSLLQREPDWTLLPDRTPSALRRLLRRCLEKDRRRRLRDIADASLALEEAADCGDGSGPAPSAVRVKRELDFQRITDFVGLKESPAVSPDGKMVAFVAVVGGRRQVWVRLLAGGAPLQLTQDDADHLEPRWAPDSSTLIYYTPGASPVEDGTIFEIGALGGPARPIAASLAGADISHDGRRLALLQADGDQPVLATVARDGSGFKEIARFTPAGYSSLRWSPDDRWIGLKRSDFSAGFNVALHIVAVRDGESHEVTCGSTLNGFSWLPDGSGFVYSSSRGSTLLYPPVYNLRTISCRGGDDHQLTFGDDSYGQPDVHQDGRLLASRIRTQSDIWKIPVVGSPAENARGAIPITRQTGQVQTPTLSPDGTRLAYVSDNGGHANVWVARTDGSDSRQITFETERSVSIGIPRWSPRGDQIAVVMNRDGQAGLWTVHPNGTGLRPFVRGWAPCWSPDGRWLYYWRLGEQARRIEKIPIDGGDAVLVRDEAGGIVIPELSRDGATLYFIRPVSDKVLQEGGGLGWGAMTEICRASPEGAPADVMVRIASTRIPGSPGPVVGFLALSPDGQWLATALIDGATTNLWALPAAGGELRALTDFGDRPILISRSAAWSTDSRSMYAAMAILQTDIVLIDGLLP